MYDEETGKPAQARASNLNEELGQVDTILSDKTGTLTCNQMDFLKCSIAGVSYGMILSEVVIAAAKLMAVDRNEQDLKTSCASMQHNRSQDMRENNGTDVHRVVGIELKSGGTSRIGSARKPLIKGFSFEDDRLMNGNWLKEPNSDVILMFFRILALCHPAIPEPNEESGVSIMNQRHLMEELSLLWQGNLDLNSAKEHSQVCSLEKDILPLSSQSKDSWLLISLDKFREFKILTLLEFSSKRKRMSVIVKDEDGQILLLCKGADSIIFDRLSKNGGAYEEGTSKHLHEYGEAGMRTLVFAYRKLDNSGYSAWNSEFIKAKTTIGIDREAILERVSDLIEKDFILMVATALEDKLHKGAPQCIDKLAQAGLKIWVNLDKHRY